MKPKKTLAVSDKVFREVSQLVAQLGYITCSELRNKEEIRANDHDLHYVQWGAE